MQRIPVPALMLALFASVVLSSCLCDPCAQRAAARKAAAAARYGTGNPGALPDPTAAAAPARAPAPAPSTAPSTTAQW